MAPKIDIVVLRRIARTHWDPIGVGPYLSEDSDNEYDRYMRKAVQMMIDGRDDYAVRKYLLNIFDFWRDTERAEIATDRTVEELRAYIAAESSPKRQRS
jgi:flagellar motor component MotA